VAKPLYRDEIEIKLRVTDLAGIRKRLKLLHAREIVPRTHELNTLFDTPRQRLRQSGQLIRLRIEQPASASGKYFTRQDFAAVLTYKGPAFRRNSPRAGNEPRRRSRYKIREEAEVRVSGANELPRILRALGLRPSFRYEKFRTTYAIPGLRGLKVELDETPVGVFLELEGPEKAIDRAARFLGYGRESYLKDTYGSLHLAACRAQRRKPGDMLFPPTKKLR
jgi:adenylate cyclase class 2